MRVRSSLAARRGGPTLDVPTDCPGARPKSDGRTSRRTQTGATMSPSDVAPTSSPRRHQPDRTRDAACCANARRKLFAVHAAAQSPLAWEALQHIAALHEIEATIRRRPPPGHSQRAEPPWFAKLRTWSEKTPTPILDKIDMASAIRYPEGRPTVDAAERGSGYLQRSVATLRRCAGA